jgi:hypothetical protein
MVWVEFIQAFEKCSGGNWRGASATMTGCFAAGHTPFERYDSTPSLPQASDGGMALGGCKLIIPSKLA